MATWLTKKGVLVKTEETIFWATSVQVLGENFELEKAINIPIATKLQMEKKTKTKNLTWNFMFNGVPLSSTNFLNGKKEVRPPKKVKTDPKSKQSNLTYFRFTIPPVADVKSFLKVFKRTFSVVTKIDRKAIILPKPGSSDNIFAISDPDSLGSAPHLGRFTTERLWVRPDIPTTITLLIGHEEKAIDFTCNQVATKLAAFEASIRICNIQSIEQACVGWMLGSHPGMDPQYMAELYRINPRLSNYDIDCKFELVKLTPTKRYVRENSARAMFIYCKEGKQEAVAKGLKAIYNKPHNFEDHRLPIW